MRHLDPATLPDVSGCIEATVESGSNGIVVCPCGVNGTEISISGIIDGGMQIIGQIVRHYFSEPPLIMFDPEATAVADGHLLGPGLHYAIEYERYIEHEFRNGRMTNCVSQTTALNGPP